jgi:hypothetical protein
MRVTFRSDSDTATFHSDLSVYFTRLSCYRIISYTFELVVVDCDGHFLEAIAINQPKCVMTVQNSIPEITEHTSCRRGWMPGALVIRTASRTNQSAVSHFFSFVGIGFFVKIRFL